MAREEGVPMHTAAPHRDPFDVERDQARLESLLHSCPRFWRWLGGVETWCHRRQLKRITIDRPIYIAGFARSGTTILLELLANHSEVGTHRYRDFPGIFAPIWWQQIQDRAVGKRAIAVERAHGDGIHITLDSPEAMEEPIWMAFFPLLHQERASHVLSATLRRPDFERFYRDHLRKLLLLRGARRYACKGNYNLTRISYLQRVCPDARFVLPIRHPQAHVASLIKQHKLFMAGQKRNPRAIGHLQRVGHFEFGCDRRIINVGRTDVVQEIRHLWSQGQEVRGWARYWASLYGWLADTLEQQATLREAAIILRYEELCRQPQVTLRRLLHHCQLREEASLRSFATRIKAPTYYRQGFSDEERSIIAEETATVAQRMGYGEPEMAMTAC
jgi:hypothetical protein